MDLDAAIVFRSAPPEMANENRAMMTAFETADFSTWPTLLVDLRRLAQELRAIRGRRYLAGSGDKLAESQHAPAAGDGSVDDTRTPAAGPTERQDSMGIDVCGEFRRLEALFQAGSAKWASVESLLRIWPESDTPPEFPNHFRPQSIAPRSVDSNDSGSAIMFRGIDIGGIREDTPDRRFRPGRAGAMLLRYDDSGLWGNPSEMRDEDAAYTCGKRLKFLSTKAGKLLSQLHGLGILSADTLTWSGPVFPPDDALHIRWTLAVHELIPPDDTLHVKLAECHRIRDFFYASAQACSILAERFTPATPAAAIHGRTGGELAGPVANGGARRTPITSDVFLSYNSADRPNVERLANMLVRGGLSVWMDKEKLVGGEDWQDGIGKGIDCSSSVAVCIGPSGFGPWQEVEVKRALIRERADPKFTVIPALLPGAPDKPKLPLGLDRFHHRSFREGFNDDELQRLVRDVKGATYPTPENLERDKWVYEQHMAGKTIPAIREGLLQEAHSRDGDPLDSDNRIQDAWKRYAKHYRLPLKKRRSGPPR